MTPATAFRTAVMTANGTTVLGAVGTGIGNLIGVLHSISVGSDTTAVTITIFDNTAASGTVIFQAAVAIGQDACFVVDGMVANGLTAVVAGGTTPSITVSYR